MKRFTCIFAIFGCMITTAIAQMPSPSDDCNNSMPETCYLGRGAESSQGVDPRAWKWPTIDPKAEKYYSTSPYAFCNNNPVKNIDPNGMYWYSYNETYEDKNGNEQTRTSYAYNEERLSRKEMRAMGYERNIGLVAVKGGEYLSLEGGRVDANNSAQTIETMQSDFGQMGAQDFASNLNVANSYLSGVNRNGSLPPVVDIAGQMYVVGSGSNHYLNVNDRGLNSAFNNQLRANGQEPRFHAVNAPSISGTTAMMLDWAVMNAYAPPITGYSRMNGNLRTQIDRNRGNRLIQYYRQAGLIR